MAFGICFYYLCCCDNKDKAKVKAGVKKVKQDLAKDGQKIKNTYNKDKAKVKAFFKKEK